MRGLTTAATLEFCLYTVYTISMKAIIQKWGNSLGIRIPAYIARDMSWENGCAVELVEEDNRLIIQNPSKTQLDELLDQLQPEQLHGEQFARRAGAEIL